MKPKIRDKNKAIKLRKEGKSIREIARILRVAKSSVSIWVRGIRDPIKRPKRIKEKRTKAESNAIRNQSISRHYRVKRSVYQELGRNDAHEMGALHLKGCMLYWAEGTKSRHTVSFTNSDADMIRFFGMFLRECYELDPNSFKLGLNCYLNNGLTLEEIESFWKNELCITDPNFKFTYHTIKESESKSKRRHPYGICNMRVTSVEVVQRIYGAIQEYMGIVKDEWLG